ncbi:MAG TPA: phosphoribosyl-ATP diphosphatase [Acidimicrobiia bacterium]|nr:phosphoribosyl-ATP diphosphatase [Acidimicrobiia bacterium]
MIVPSIDIVGGTTVQLIGGEKQALDAGNPISVLGRFARVGEVAVVDIDAARGEGENYDLIAEMCRIAPIRVGGGVRDVDLARRWLDAGATQVIVGTAASVEMLSGLPSERVLVALDARDGQVVTHGWRQDTGIDLIQSVRRFAGLCAGFLVTFVEREGRMGGTDLELARRVVEAAGESKVTIAGGVTTAEEVAELDRLGADAQVGMALYTGRLGLAEAFAAPLVSDRPDGLWPTVIVDEHDVALGLAYSSLESLQQALESGRGVYHSRKRGIWVKGEHSGATQELVEVSVDCDRDTLRFRVRQQGSFCHLGTRTCWGEDRGLARLGRRLRTLAADRPEDSNTVRLLDDVRLLDTKIVEEAAELIASDADIAPEAADLVYFALVKSVAAGVSVEDIERILDHRERRVTRRPIGAKEVE